MNKSDIISAISIEFILSKDEAEKIVEVILKTMSESLRENKNLDIPQFGEFKVIKKDNDNKSVRFSASKRLSKRINYSFNNLEKIEMSYTEPEAMKADDEFSFTISKEFLEQKKEYERYSEDIAYVKQETSTGGENMKKLISDELVKLHQEIIELSGKEGKRNNLWG